MSFYKSIKKIWRENPGKIYKDKIIEWRKGPSTVKLKKPTRIDRARNLGYKAKEGIVVVRQRIIRGGKKKQDFGRRRTKRSGRRLNLSKNYKTIAEERASRKYRNLEVLNSYFLAKDGKYCWYEVILVDWSHPAIRKDKKLKFLIEQRRRVHRGLTSSARKSRGLRKKGKKSVKARPSRRAVVKKRIAKKK